MDTTLYRGAARTFGTADIEHLTDRLVHVTMEVGSITHTVFGRIVSVDLYVMNDQRILTFRFKGGASLKVDAKAATIIISCTEADAANREELRKLMEDFKREVDEPPPSFRDRFFGRRDDGLKRQ